MVKSEVPTVKNTYPENQSQLTPEEFNRLGKLMALLIQIDQRLNGGKK